MPQTNLALLIQVLASLREFGFVAWRLVLLGDWPTRDSLAVLGAREELTERAEFIAKSGGGYSEARDLRS